jgi:hypothetical protein
MISKFSVLYVGQIELDNVGIHGTPADARRYPNERLVDAYHTARDISQHMDELGCSRSRWRCCSRPSIPAAR